MISSRLLGRAGLLATVALASCGKKAAAPTTAGAVDPAVAAAISAALDPSVEPCDDFYQYACGGWLATTEIPSDRVMWNRSFSTIMLRNEEMIRGILEDAAKNPAGDANKEKLGNFYGACMDEDAVEARGMAAVAPLLADIDAVKTTADFAKLAGRLQATGGSPLFEAAIYADFKDPSLNIAHMSQGGLGLPDRDYYLSDDANMKALREGYVSWMTRSLVLSGLPEASAADLATRVLVFETELARVSVPREDLEDPEKTYHRIERSGLIALAPDFPWNDLFAAMGAKDLTTINVEVPDFFTQMPKIVASTPPEVLRAYLRANVMRDDALGLPKAVQEENFAFYGKALYGQPEMKPRWRRCVDATQSAMGELLGQAYVKQAFAGNSKATAEDMIKGIEGAFEGGLDKLAWMDDGTRAHAVEKARAITNKIGYPDHWRDYSGLSVNRNDWFATLVDSRDFNVAYELHKAGQPVDRSEWYMPPQMVNAYYNPLNNEIVFPAGILQPPFFAASNPRAMNYGAIGMVMGHELTHGFDNAGRKFDPQGRMQEWWDPAAAERFETAAACVTDRYNSYQVQDGVNVNGQLTLGENIADFGGIKTTYRAYEAWQKSSGVREPDVAGLTPEQLLFVSFAQGWCSKVRPETERVLVATDSHSPPKYRVNGPLSNLPEFAAAFSCPTGSPMVADKACTVW